jgi:hypothetical protein
MLLLRFHNTAGESIMQCNVGKKDQTIRVLLGAVIIAVGVAFGNWWLAAVGLVPIITGVVRFCPAYLPLGLSTVEKTPE